MTALLQGPLPYGPSLLVFQLLVGSSEREKAKDTRGIFIQLVSTTHIVWSFCPLPMIRSLS